MASPSDLEKIVYAAEQILSYYDEILRASCPRCGEQKTLSIEPVGRDVIIRCSVAIHEVNAEEWEDLIPNACTFVAHVKPSNLLGEPFNLPFAEKRPGRPTAKNLPKPRTRRKRAT